MENILSFAWYNKVYLVIVICLWSYWIWSRRKFYAFALNFPGKFGLPFFGFVYMMKHPDDFLDSLRKIFEEVRQSSALIWLGWYPFLLTKDPELIKQILTSPDCIGKPMPMYNSLRFVLLDGIITSDEKEWRYNRGHLNPAFRKKALITFFPLINDVKNDLVNEFNQFAEKGEHFVLETILNNFFGLSLATLMGRQVNISLEHRNYMAKRFIAIVRTTYFFLIFSFVKLHPILQLSRSFRDNLKTVYDFIRKALDNKFNKLDNRSMEPNALENDNNNNDNTEEVVPFSMQLYNLQKEQKFNSSDVLRESVTLVSAALETSSNTLHSALVFLSTHPIVQESLFQEILTVFKDKSTNVKFEHLEQLPYLDMVLQETLRLAPAVPIIARKTSKPIQLPDGKVVPQDVAVGIGIYFLHRCKDIWGPDAEKFNPDNFLPGRIDDKHPYAYMPFSKGSRNCIGWQYARFNLKIMLIGLIRNFRFETEFKYEDLKMRMNISLMFFEDPALKIYRRS